ncbi:MAG TPA: hypothetical protein VHV77_12850 [Pirellulales bacterium]|nr:hypothetical protein [Pirellulales bacterium]
MPSRFLSWLLGVIGDWLAIYAYAAMRAWSHCSVGGASPVGNQKFLNSFGSISSIGTATAKQRLIAAIGIKTSNSDALVSFSSDGLDFSNSGVDLGFANFNAVGADNGGALFGGLVAVATCKFYALNTGTSGTFTPGNSSVVEAAHYSVSHYLIGAGATVYSAITLGGTWTSTGIGSVGDSIRTFVHNGDAPPSGLPRVILGEVLVANSHYVVRYSSDDGVTWTLGKDFGVVALSLCYSEASDQFLALDTTNKQLWSSADGTTWTLLRTVASLDTGGISGHHTMAACGPAIAHLVKHTSVANQQLNGIAYTLDLGLTWREVYFGNVNTGQPMRALINANGRFVALDDFNTYVSGFLEANDGLYSGA